jgi:hypothetical protein
MTDREGGSVGVQFLGILCFIAVAAGGAAAVVAGTYAYQRRSDDAYRPRMALEEAAGKVVAALGKDPTPEADGLNDSVWELDGAEIDGIRLGVRDLSSGLNANFVRKGVFEKTELARLLAPGRTAQELQQYREDSGLSPFPGHYDSFFTIEALGGHIASYGWANINVSDEFALRSLCAAITGSEATAESFHAKIRSALADRRILAPSDLPGFLGIDFDALYPILNAEPAMNVNFVSPFILRQLLSYPDYALPDAETKAETLLAERERGEIDGRRLKELLAVEDNHPLLHYFGPVTWFWEITADRAGSRLTTVAARFPPAAASASGSPGAFRIIETRYER